MCRFKHRLADACRCLQMHITDITNTTATTSENQLDTHQKIPDSNKKTNKKREKHKQKTTKNANENLTHTQLPSLKNKKPQRNQIDTLVLLWCRCCEFSECFVCVLRLLLVFVVCHVVCVCKCLFVRLCRALLLCGACVSSLGSWDSRNVLRAQP